MSECVARMFILNLVVGIIIITVLHLRLQLSINQNSRHYPNNELGSGSRSIVQLCVRSELSLRSHTNMLLPVVCVCRGGQVRKVAKLAAEN